MLETSFQITCNGCGDTDGWPEMNVTKARVRAALAKSGWQSYGALDYCPECIKRGVAKRRENRVASGVSRTPTNEKGVPNG